MRKAAATGIILAGAILVAGGLDKESGSENFVADVQANDETTQTEEETDSDPESEEEAALAAQIDTSAPVTKGSRIAVVSKSVDGEYWKALHSGMEDAIKDVNAAYGFTSDDQITMTFEGASDEQDVEKQVNTLDAVIAENPTVLCLSAGDEDSCQAQLEAARENDIAVVAFDSNVSDSDMIAVFRGTDNVYVGLFLLLMLRGIFTRVGMNKDKKYRLRLEILKKEKRYRKVKSKKIINAKKACSIR